MTDWILNPSGTTPSISAEYTRTTSASWSKTASRDYVLSSLVDACMNASEFDWDGYQAQPAQIDAYILTRRLLASLPESIPDPEVDVTPQGKFMLFWQRRVDHLFSMTVGADGGLAYAARYGSTRKSGTSIFADFIPQSVLRELFHLYS